MSVMRLCSFFCMAASAGCANPIELNNVTADNASWLSRNPEVAQILEQRSIPQDDHFHWSVGAQQLKDKAGNPIGWEGQLAVKFAWPLHEPAPVVLRPRVPAKTYPPDRQAK